MKEKTLQRTKQKYKGSKRLLWTIVYIYVNNISNKAENF